MSFDKWDNIQICRVETPSIMWVKFLDMRTQPLFEDFKKLQHQLDTTFHKGDYKRYDYGETLENEQPAIVCHDGSWCRCIIITVTETSKHVKRIDVFLVDLGIHVNVQASNVYPLAAGMWCSVPYLCRRIQLVGTAPAELCWTAEDGTDQLCFRAGKFWSSATKRFIKEVAESPHTCSFSPSVPFIVTINQTTPGNLDLEITNRIGQILYGFNYENEEQLAKFENLTDILVSCKMAVTFDEDLTDHFEKAKKESSSSQAQHHTVIRLVDPVRNAIYNDPVIEETRQIENVSDYVRGTPLKMFRMALSPMYKSSLDTKDISSSAIFSIDQKQSTSFDLSDIPLPSAPALIDIFPLNSTSNSNLDTSQATTDVQHVKENSLTGYEKKVKRISSPLKQSETKLNLDESKIRSNLDIECKIKANKDIDVPKIRPNLDYNKSKVVSSNYASSNFSRPLFVLAKLRLVYNCGKKPVPADELIRDEADSRKVINRTVLDILKRGDFRVLPLQTFMWPTVVRGRSCVAVERRSNGKTLGFLVPLASQILDTMSILLKYAPTSAGPLGIIVCPNWSSVSEVTSLLEDLTRFTSVRVAAFFGGMSKSSTEEDQKTIFSVDILVTTMPSLPRLGLPLLKEKSPWDESIPCISLDKCLFLVFDNFEVIYEKFPQMTDSLIDKWLNNVQHCETTKQVVITSKQWNKDIEKVTDKISLMNPNILISSIFEAAVASLVKTRLDCCKTEPLLSQAVCDAICHYSGKKIIVFLDGPHSAERLRELLNTKAIVTINVTSADKPVVKMAMDLWINARSCVMLILEVAFIEYMASGIKDADVIIHASIPPGTDHLGMRYSYMLDKFENVERGKADCISHFILTSEMITKKPQIIPELERIGIDIVDKVKVAYDEGMRRRKADVATKDICFSHKSFGWCPKKNCILRHFLTQEDEPKMLPTSGQVKLEIIDVISASCFLARIRCYRSTTGHTTNLEKVYQRVHDMLQEFYHLKENRKCINRVSEGSLCALETQSWVRGEIVKVDFSEQRVLYTVKMIDERGLEERSSDSLYELPDVLKSLPPLAVEVYLSNIKPVDEDTHFTEYAKHMASSRLLNHNSQIYFTGVIRLALRATLIIDELVEIRTIAKIPKETSYLARELVQYKLATTNMCHLDNLVVNVSGGEMQFAHRDDSWLKYYEPLENPFYITNNAQMVDIESERELNDISNVSSDSDTIVNGISGTDSENSFSKSIKKMDVLKSKLRFFQTKTTPVVGENSTRSASNFVDSPINISKVSPPPSCITPNQSCTTDTAQMYDTDAKDIGNLSNGSYDTLINGNVASINEASFTRSTKKIDAFKSKLHLLQSKTSSAAGENFTREISTDVPKVFDSPSQNSKVGPPPACATPTKSECCSDRDDIMSYSNFDYIECNREPSEISFDSGLFKSNSIELSLNEVIEVNIADIKLNSFFITKINNINMFNLLEEELERKVQKFTPFNPDEDISGLYIAQFSDGMHYRAQLLSESEEGTCNAYFVDYGDELVVSWDKIYKCPPRLCEIPWQAIHCKLDGIKIPRKHLIAARKYMDKIIDSRCPWHIKPVSAVKQENGVMFYAVELFTKNGKDDINMSSSLLEAGYAEVCSRSDNLTKLNDEKLQLRNERIGRLINDREFLHSPTETIKEFLQEECFSVGSVKSINGDDESSIPLKLSKTARIASVMKRIHSKKHSSPGVIRETDEGIVGHHLPSSERSQGCRSNSHVDRYENRNHPLSSNMQNNIRHPHTIWKDTDFMIFIRFQLVGVEDFFFDANNHSILFSTTVNGVEYTFNDDLFANIVSETASCSTNAREVVVKLSKESRGRWPRLLSVAGRIPWLKRDIPACSSVCSSSTNKSFAGWKSPSQIQQYGGLPAGISDDDTLQSESTTTDGEDELFKFG